MADTDAAAQAPEGRLIILPVDLDEASVTAVSWAARHVLRNGARSMRRLLAVRRCGCEAPRCATGKHSAGLLDDAKGHKRTLGLRLGRVLHSTAAMREMGLVR